MRAQTVLIASLFLVACSPSATVSAPPEAPVATPVVVAEPVADVPSAAHGRALSGGVPRVVLVGATLRVNGAAAGDVADLSEPSRGRALAAALSNSASPASRTDASVGVFELLVPSSTKASVVRSILETAAGAGFPHGRLLVAGLSPSALHGLDVDANGEPASASHGRILHVAAMEGNVLVAWKDGDKILAAADVSRPSDAAPGGLPELAAKVAAWWGTFGQHRDASDLDADRAVIQIGDGEDVATLVAILDALAATTRPRGSEQVPAFHVALRPITHRPSPPVAAPVKVGPPSPASPLPAKLLVDADGRATIRTNAGDALGTVIHAAEGTFRRCYTDGLQRDPALRGSVRISFVIEQTGHVSNAVVSQPDLPDPAVVACLVGAVSALEFSPQSTKVNMTIPLNFRSVD